MRSCAPCSCCSCGCLIFVLPVVLIAAVAAMIIALVSGNATFTIEPYSWQTLHELVLTAGAALALL